MGTSRREITVAPTSPKSKVQSPKSESKVQSRSRKGAAAVSAITDTRAFDRDITLRAQIGDCVDSVISNIGEGHGQATDRGFANYLAISRGSVLEAKSHLAVAVARKRICAELYAPLGQEAPNWRR